MRKIFFLFVFVVFTTTSSFAGITVKSGSVAVVNEQGTVASFVFDYSKLLIEDKPMMEYLKGRGDDVVRDWPKESAACEEEFLNRWNQQNKRGLTLTENSDAKYKMVITVEKLDLGSFGASFVVGFGAGGAKMSGKIEIFENGNAQPILTLTVVDQTGRSKLTEQKRRANLYRELVDDALKEIKEYQK